MGEWQKIALARAFVRDTQIVVLDEPTSFLDVQAEHEVFNRFRQLAAGRSTILISHRLSTVRMADRIYVLEDGRITESGRHDELIRRGRRLRASLRDAGAVVPVTTQGVPAVAAGRSPCSFTASVSIRTEGSTAVCRS